VAEAAARAMVTPNEQWERVVREAIYPVPQVWAQTAYVDAAGYQARYARSIADPDGFWREEAQRIDWSAPFTTVFSQWANATSRCCSGAVGRHGHRVWRAHLLLHRVSSYHLLLALSMMQTKLA